MHFMPDTEDEDSAAETFWPEGYKWIIREDVRLLVREELFKEKPFNNVYKQGYTAKFADYSEFLEKIADMVAVGAENGADDVFNIIIDAFLTEAPLPQLRTYAHYTELSEIPEELKLKLKQNIIEEYSEDNVYVHAYKVGYTKHFSCFDDYITRIADLVVTGTMNGANDVLESMYLSFIKLAPVITARRHPRRLKMW